MIDIHFYSDGEESWQKDLASIEHEKLLAGLKEQPGKTLLVGEFGAFKGRFGTVPEAARWMSALAKKFPAAGFQGWIYWTYDTEEQKELWNGMSEGAQILKALP